MQELISTWFAGLVAHLLTTAWYAASSKFEEADDAAARFWMKMFVLSPVWPVTVVWVLKVLILDLLEAQGRK